MASQGQTQDLGYENLENSICQLEGKEEPFSHDTPGWSVMGTSKTNTIDNPWFLVLISLNNALTSNTVNLSYDQKRRLLNQFKTKFVNGTKCGKAAVRRAEKEKMPPRVGDFCDFIGWKINDLGKEYTPPNSNASLSELSARALSKDQLDLAKEYEKEGIITKLPKYLGGKKTKSKRKLKS
tara:strand:+ start:490 stop:1032 length:543 start_codon:yes stop_codon:yes gene_type:complete